METVKTKSHNSIKKVRYDWGRHFFHKIRVCSVLQLEDSMWREASDQKTSTNKMGTLMFYLKNHRCFQN